MRKRDLVILAIGAIIIAFTAACGGWNDERGRGDAPVGARHDGAVEVWNFPDKFPNIAARCIGEDGVYVTTREAPPVVVANDPNCDEGGILADQP